VGDLHRKIFLVQIILLQKNEKAPLSFSQNLLVTISHRTEFAFILKIGFEKYSCHPTE
jgi:hypothetical protein